MVTTLKRLKGKVFLFVNKKGRDRLPRRGLFIARFN